MAEVAPPTAKKGPRKWLIGCGGVAVVIIIIAVIASASGGSPSNVSTSNGGSSTASSSASSSSHSAAGTPAPTPVPTRDVTGTKVTLGAGTFTGGQDVAVGLYNVTPGAGQSGNFIVTGTDEYDEILGGPAADGGVPEVRAQISDGDSIEIDGLSSVTFTPVTTPLVTSYSTMNLYAGTWTVGQDLGPGRYTATPGAGQSGNFIIEAEGVDEILGGSAADGGVPSVTFNVSDGDVVDISGMSQVTLTPTS